MDNTKIGAFIAEQRKKREMTQKELADILGVTDKAVSKWERGAGYPEITLLPKLSESLGVTLGELFGGEKTQQDGEIIRTEQVVADPIVYAEKVSFFQRFKNVNLMVSTITILFLLAAFVCVVCNYAISGMLDWSLYPLGSLAMAWLILILFIKAKKHKVFAALTGLTVCILPFLMLVEHLTPIKGWVLPLAVPIVLLSVPSLWIVAFIWCSGIKRFYALSITFFLLGVALDAAINKLVAGYLNQPFFQISNVVNLLSFSFVTLLFLVLGVVTGKKVAK